MLKRLFRMYQQPGRQISESHKVSGTLCWIIKLYMTPSNRRVPPTNNLYTLQNRRLEPNLILFRCTREFFGRESNKNVSFLLFSHIFELFPFRVSSRLNNLSFIHSFIRFTRFTSNHNLIYVSKTFYKTISKT